MVATVVPASMVTMTIFGPKVVTRDTAVTVDMRIFDSNRLFGLMDSRSVGAVAIVEGLDRVPAES